jgi:hypothetical protein
LDFSDVNREMSSIEKFTEYSEDDLIEWAQKPPVEQLKLYNDFLSLIPAIRSIKRKHDFELGLGLILKQSTNLDNGTTFPGFLAATDSNGSEWILPYESGSIINKNNPLLRQNIGQMQSSAGRRAIVIYKNIEPYEVKHIYLLPFALMPPAEQEIYLTDLLQKVRGAYIGIYHSKWSTERGERYRILTVNGISTVRAYMEPKQKIGSIFIIHPQNPRPLATKYVLGASGYRQAIELFIKNTNLDLAVKAGETQSATKAYHLILSKRGDFWKEIGDDKPDNAIFAVDIVPWGTGKKIFTILEEYPASDRLLIMSSFFSIRPENLGTTAKTTTGKDGHLLAQVVMTNGNIIRRPIDLEIKPGTPVFCRPWIDQKTQKQKIESILLPRFAVDGACSSCFGIGWALCAECRGDDIICTTCNGTGMVVCSACHGTQKCTLCGGSGVYSDTGHPCLKCNGTGICIYCQKRGGQTRCKAAGCDWGKIKCPSCQGKHISACGCGGNNRGKFIEIIS